MLYAKYINDKYIVDENGNRYQVDAIFGNVLFDLV
jgi:hypothetical protein